MKEILILCEGNICRSPMAEGLLAAKLPDVRIRSAGLGAMVGWPAHDESIRLMKTLGIDITGHRAAQVTEKMCLAADMVFVMDNDQRHRVEVLYPTTRGRVFKLGHFTNQDIPDPFRKPDSAFAITMSLIQEAISSWLAKINRL